MLDQIFATIATQEENESQWNYSLPKSQHVKSWKRLISSQDNRAFYALETFWQKLVTCSPNLLPPLPQDTDSITKFPLELGAARWLNCGQENMEEASLPQGNRCPLKSCPTSSPHCQTSNSD